MRSAEIASILWNMRVKTRKDGIMDKQDSLSDNDQPLAPLTDRQNALIRVIQALDPELRHTITLQCRGTEPWKLERVVEHRDIELRPAAKANQ